MKNKCRLLFVCFFVLFTSCKKNSSETPAETTYVIKVKEHKTNIPLAGVKISLYRCSNYDAVFGCQSKSLFASYSTDSKGEYTISQGDLNKANEGIILSKHQYWDRYGGTGEIPLEPEAWVQIVLKAGKIYPDTSIFSIKTTGELGIASFQLFKAPKDSVINFRLFGNEVNEVSWLLYTKDSGCFQYCILDTLAFGKLSLTPQKFQTVNTSVIY